MYTNYLLVAVSVIAGLYGVLWTYKTPANFFLKTVWLASAVEAWYLLRHPVYAPLPYVTFYALFFGFMAYAWPRNNIFSKFVFGVIALISAMITFKFIA